MKQVDEPTKLAQISEGVATIMERLEPIKEAAEGYRRQLIAQDWSPPVAEAIAAKFLTDLTTRIINMPTEDEQ